MSSEFKAKSLEETPTWAVAVVCFVLLAISIVIEQLLHVVEKWLKKKQKPALVEALEKVKAELMLLGFISLLLTILQGTIADMCIPKSIAATWHPCSKKQEEAKAKKSKDDDECMKKGKVALVSSYGIHQLHIFIFVLAVVHVLYCITTYFLGRTKMRRWKTWEEETKTLEYQYHNDPERFRFARETSFGRRHLHLWSRSPVFLWINPNLTLYMQSSYMVHCSVAPVDRYTWIELSSLVTVHSFSCTQTHLDIYFYLNILMLPAYVYAHAYSLSSPSSSQNAFQIAFFIWSTYSFSLKSCYHARNEAIIIRITLGVVVQIICSYVTLPLYALVTQMGSSMRPTVFNDRVAAALKTWHHAAKKQTKHGKNSESHTPMSSRPQTPSYGMSPAHLLHHHRSSTAPESFSNSPRLSNHDNIDQWEAEANSVHDYELHESVNHGGLDVRDRVTQNQDPTSIQLPRGPGSIRTQHEINLGSARDFTFRN
ncbi:MLO-LIKE PROTEIN [Salix koriyanagi]|uniref:MLO-like protein n=1 Tax=Salix koriyanagi TaxID=2511006 RepID=A0A9Q0WIG2_9ROSI|nr:MLO-LIKE PROTEIN [Salix koriyanagi]